MNITPMLGGYELPGIQRIGTIERRALVEVAVPGLEGSYHQDLGSGAIAIRIEGTLAGDEARDAFLAEVRGRFAAGDPVDFVADIVTATSLEQTHLEDLAVTEVAGSADTFRYALTLVQYVEPPPPAADLGFDGLDELDADLGLEALDLFNALQVPDLLGSIPELSDPTPPLAQTLDGVKAALAGLDGVSSSITDLFG